MRRLRAGIAALALAVAACGNEDQGPVAGAEYARMKADNVMTGIEHFITTEGIRQAVLRADTGYFHEDSARVELVTVHLTMFGNTGERSAELTSDTGDLNQRTEAMVARGNVVLETVDGRRVHTEELHYDPRQHRIWSDVRTVHVENGSVLEGEGFTAELTLDGQLRNLRLREPRGSTQGVKIGF